LLSKIIGEYRSAFEKQGIEVEYKTRDVKVEGGTLLEEMFTNILENTIKHSECDNVRISFEETDKHITVKIEDDGKGIPDKDKEKLLERGFKRGENAGSGLGMYLVKEIAESYGGNAEVKDSELGGARFDIRLNLA
ncbi:MAG: sensor histidine kinase, partial [Thermoplasmata archaeon]